jgi:hypothetical protein
MNLNTQALLTLNAAGAGTYTSLDLRNDEWSKGSFVVNLGTVTSASVVVTINGKDIASGQYYPLLTSAAITTAGATTLQIGAGLINSQNSSNAVLPKTYQISVAITGASAAVTGTVGGSLVFG